ncbi:MAG: protein-L-isoaspartate(D-aspartate) O-methyltransferase [Chromatiales bacterium]
MKSQAPGARALVGILLAGTIAVCPLRGGADEQSARHALVDHIAADIGQVADLDPRGEPVAATLDALRKVPRHEFVPDAQRTDAYRDQPLPIGHGQTISQPFIVAIMTALLELEPGDRVLEIGTGSGYQAAVLAELRTHVHTIEIIEPLAQGARARLARLGYDAVQTRVGDGYFGWAEHSPYDAIIVTAAASHIPQPLVRQLKAGGRMVIPVGDRFVTQHLVLVTKASDGSVQLRQLLPVRFVPLTGDH